MPRGPQGQKRLGDTVGTAIMVAKIATEEIEEELPHQGKRSGGLVGGKARARALTAGQRSEIAKKAANGRWL